MTKRPEIRRTALRRAPAGPMYPRTGSARVAPSPRRTSNCRTSEPTDGLQDALAHGARFAGGRLTTRTSYCTARLRGHPLRFYLDCHGRIHAPAGSVPGVHWDFRRRRHRLYRRRMAGRPLRIETNRRPRLCADGRAHAGAGRADWAATDSDDTALSLRSSISQSRRDSGNPASSVDAGDCRTSRCSRTHRPWPGRESDSRYGWCARS